MAQWVKNCLQCRRRRSHRFDPWVGKILWRRAWQPAPVFLPGESHGQRSLVGYSPPGHKESGMTEASEHIHMYRSHQLFNSLVSMGRNFSLAPPLSPTHRGAISYLYGGLGRGIEHRKLSCFLLLCVCMFVCECIYVQLLIGSTLSTQYQQY